MGNQQSKTGGGTPKNGSTTNLNSPSDTLQSYPSFSKSETQGSSKSFRGTIRSKIPGTAAKPEKATDSPRASASALASLDGINGENRDSSPPSSRAGSTMASRIPSNSSVQSPTSPTLPDVDEDVPSPLELEVQSSSSQLSSRSSTVVTLKGAEVTNRNVCSLLFTASTGV